MRDRRSNATELTETDPDREHYDAFVSYSHSADHEIAPKLQRALEVLATPWFRARSLRVFRDATDLAANPGLWPRLVEALDASDFFVLMASPQAARSEWVDREVEYWLTKRSPSSLLLAITAGEFAWDHEARDFDWTRTDCIPRRLAGRFRDVPTAADLRGVATLELGDPAFTEQAAKLAAPIHGRTLRELYDPEMRRYRRRLRIVGAVAVLVAVLLVIVSWQLLRIRARSREALAELLANRARIEQSIAPARAAFLAATADAVRGTARTRAAWIAAVHGLAQWTTRLEGGRLGELAPGGRSLFLVDASGGKRVVEAPAFAAGLEPQPPVDPPALRVLEGGECIFEGFFTPAPQGGDVLFCRASEVGFELRSERGSDQLWVTVSGDVRALPSPAACASAVLLRTDPVSGVESAARVDAEFVRREGHPVRRSVDDEVEEPVDAVGWAQVGNAERPATSSRCALLYLDETRQLRRWHPEQGQSLVSDTSFGRVRDYVMSPDGGWVAAEHENGTFVILQAEAASNGALAGIRWAAPLVAENGSYTGVALLDTPPAPRKLCLVPAGGATAPSCDTPLERAPQVLGGGATQQPWDTSRAAQTDVLVAADYPGSRTCRPDGGRLSCGKPFAIMRAATLAVAVSPDASRLAISQGDRVLLFELPVGARDSPRGAVASRATRLAFDGDSLWMGASGGLSLWRADGMMEIDDRPVAHLTVPAGGGRAVIEDGGGQLRLASTDGTVIELGSLSRPATVLAAAAKEPLVAVGQADGGLLLWDIERRAEAARVVMGGAILSATFRPDDRELWIVTKDTLTILPIEREELLRRTCDAIRLSAADWMRLVGQVPPVDPCADFESELGSGPDAARAQ